MRWLFLFLLLVPMASALDIPPPVGFVNDHADMLDDAQLEELLLRIEQKTTVEIAVLTIPSLEGEVLEEYANKVFREWGIGKKDVNNGVLILLVADSREIRVEVGTGLEGVLTDSMSGIIIRNRMAPSFRQGDFTGGVGYAAMDIAGLASGDPATVSAYERASQPNRDWIPIMLLLVAYSGIIIYASVKYKNDKKKREEIRKKTSSLVFVIAWIMTLFISSTILWLVLIFLLFVNVTTAGYTGFMFLPGPRGPGGFGGFGGGFSGGGGASGGW